jgi:CRISPR-associated protein (TIGR02584 family)
VTDPASYPRRILLAVTGLSPQIVTETLYALAAERRLWVPTEIRIITTRQGAEKARRTLLSADSGWFHRLRGDYRLPAIAFGVKDIHVITGPKGAPLDDILEEADNAAVADFITEEVREITADPKASLHVSIAGGRKTMGFYVGYALSLFGRAQDRLSHVLVPLSFESRNDFFYPAPGAEACVHLGDIPFVRLRDGLPERLLEGQARFSDAVAEAQKALPPPLKLHLDPATRRITAGGESIVLERPQFALYWMMAERCIAARGGVHWSDPDLGEGLLEYYRRLVNVDLDVSAQTEKAYRNFTKDNFDPAKAHVNGSLKRVLGGRRALPYRIVSQDPITGTRYHRFGLSLPPEAITIAPQACGRGRRVRRSHINRS